MRGAAFIRDAPRSFTLPDMSWTSNVVRHVLPNGLTLLIERDPSANVVAVLTHVKAGYFDEPDHWTGISHVLEHMYFKGTERRGPGEIARDVQVLGGYVNASTIYDKTVYYAVVPGTPGALERVLDIQADALTGTALDADELARELEVIIQEAKRKLDTPSAVARESLYELLFQRHRIRRWRIGTEAGLRRLTADDLRQYYHTRYVPERVTVAIVGKLNVERTVAMAERVLGSWERPAVPVEESPQESNGSRPAIRIMEGDVQRAIALVGWRSVGALHADTPALDVTASLLGHGRGSSLYRAVRAPGLASSASAMHYTPSEVGEFDIVIECERDRLNDAIMKSLDQVDELISRGPSAPELERARALSAAGWAAQFETMDGRARLYCEAEALGGYALADELYDRLMAVSAPDVRRVAAEYLDPRSGSALFYLPKGAAAEIDSTWPLPASRKSPASNATARDPAPAVRGGAAVVGGDVAVHESGVASLSLPGVDLLARPKPGSGLVSLLVHVPGLPDRETPRCAGVSRLLVRTAIRGAGGMSTAELANAAERLGGGISAASGADGLGWAITVRPAALDQAAELLRRVALEPTLAASDIAVERALQASDAKRARDDMFGHPVRRVLHEAFPDDPYGLPAVGEPDVVESIPDDQVREWSVSLARSRAVVVAVGDLETEALLAGLAPLSRWPDGKRNDEQAVGTPTFSPGRGFEQREKAQSALAMAFPAAPYGSPTRYSLAVLCSLLSGLAGRLFEALREQRSLAYTVTAAPWLRRRAGAVLTYIATSPEREDEAREAMLVELARLVTDPATPEELERARNYVAGTIEIAHQRGSSLAADILDAWMYGLIDEFHTDADKMRAVSVAEVTTLAQQTFHEHTRAEFVVRGSGRSR